MSVFFSVTKKKKIENTNSTNVNLFTNTLFNDMCWLFRIGSIVTMATPFFHLKQAVYSLIVFSHTSTNSNLNQLECTREQAMLVSEAVLTTSLPVTSLLVGRSNYISKTWIDIKQHWKQIMHTWWMCVSNSNVTANSKMHGTMWRARRSSCCECWWKLYPANCCYPDNIRWINIWFTILPPATVSCSIIRVYSVCMESQREWDLERWYRIITHWHTLHNSAAHCSIYSSTWNKCVGSIVHYSRALPISHNHHWCDLTRMPFLKQKREHYSSQRN